MRVDQLRYFDGDVPSYSPSNEMLPFSLQEITTSVPTLADVDLQPLDMILRNIRG